MINDEVSAAKRTSVCTGCEKTRVHVPICTQGTGISLRASVSLDKGMIALFNNFAHTICGVADFWIQPLLCCDM